MSGFEIDFSDQSGALTRAYLHTTEQDTYSANGKSIVENTSSSGHIDYVKNEFVLTGRSGISAQVYTGRFDVNTWTFTGHLSNEICEALA